MTGDFKLSQAEIDALLNQTTPDQGEPVSTGPNLSDMERDALGEIGNISFGSAATSLSTLLQQRVEITTPQVNLLRQDTVHNEFPRPYVMVSVEFTEGLSGVNALAIELQDAKTIADLMLGGDGLHAAGELNELHLSAVGEAMNQMMGSAATAMSTIFGRTINISPPRVEVVDLSSAGGFVMGDSEWLVDVAFQLRVGTLIDSKIMQLLPYEFARTLVAALSGSGDLSQPTAAPAPSVSPSPEQSGGSSLAAAETAASLATALPPLAPPPAAMTSQPALQQVPQPVLQPSAPVVAPPPQVVQRPEFVDFSIEAAPVAKEQRNLALLYDVPLTVTVELGRTKKTIRDILDLSSGAILELDKLAGEPVDILVNNKRIAIGEVVVIDENFGVRVTDILSPIERVKNLQ